MEHKYKKIVDFIRQIFDTQDFIPLHEPKFIGNEKKYVLDTIETTFVSSVGQYVNKFEEQIAEYTGSPYAVAIVNGTNALYLALKLIGVKQNDEVITQPLTFIATSNSIKYLDAHPVYIDISEKTLGLDPYKVADFLKENAIIKEENGKPVCYNKLTGRRIKACVPVHTFGHPVEIDTLVEVCNEYYIEVVEDAAESLGSFYKGKHTGTFGKAGILSFNGNKIITTGGGGMILTADESLAKKAKHLSTQAKLPHPWEYIHDEVGYNFRLTNIQAALGVAQMEKLEYFVERKRWLAQQYADFFSQFEDILFFTENDNSRWNYWLNVLMFKNLEERNEFLKYSNEKKVMTRAAWKLMPDLPMYKNELTYKIENAKKFYERIVNIPSSVII